MVDQVRVPVVASQGKRVRSAFVLSAVRAVSGCTNDEALRAAVAIELGHNFSLVHDDVMDADKLRRSLPACACALGGLAGGAGPDGVEVLRRFGTTPGSRSSSPTTCWASGVIRR